MAQDRSLSQPGSERYYSHAELKTIQKFNSLFNKVVVLPSNTFCGRNFTSFTNGDYRNITVRGEFWKTSDEELIQYGQNANSDLNIRGADHYSSEYQHVPKKKRTNEIKLIENFVEDIQSQTVIFHKLKTGNYLKKYTSFSRIMYERNSLCDGSVALEKIKTNFSEKSKLIISHKVHHNLLDYSMNSNSKYYDYKCDNYLYVYPISFSNNKEINTTPYVKSIHSKEPSKKSNYKKIKQHLRERTSRTNRNKISNHMENSSLMKGDLKLRRTERSVKISGINYSKLDFQSIYLKFPEQCQFFVKNMSITEAGLTESNEILKCPCSNENSITSLMNVSYETSLKTLVESQQNEELSAEAKNNITMILNEIKICIVKKLLRKKLLELPSCNCEKIQHISTKSKQPDILRKESDELGNHFGTYNAASKIINEEKIKEREEKIKQLVEEVVTHDRCISRGENFNQNIFLPKPSNIKPETNSVVLSEEAPFHTNIQVKINREKRIQSLIKLMSVKCYDTKVKPPKYKTENNSSIINIKDIKKPPEQYDRKKQRETRLVKLVMEMKRKQKCSCGPCEKKIDDALSEYTSTELCNFEKESKSTMTEEKSSIKTENLSSIYDELNIFEKLASEEKPSEKELFGIDDFSDRPLEDNQEILNDYSGKIDVPLFSSGPSIHKEKRGFKIDVSEELKTEKSNVHKEHTKEEPTKDDLQKFDEVKEHQIDNKIKSDTNIAEEKPPSTQNSAEMRTTAGNIEDSEIGIVEDEVQEIETTKESTNEKLDEHEEHIIEEPTKAEFQQEFDKNEEPLIDDRIEDDFNIDTEESSKNPTTAEMETDAEMSQALNEGTERYELNAPTTTSLILQKDESSAESILQKKVSTEKEHSFVENNDKKEVPDNTSEHELYRNTGLDTSTEKEQISDEKQIVTDKSKKTPTEKKPDELPEISEDVLGKKKDGLDQSEKTIEDNQQINGFGNGQKKKETQDTEHHKMEKEITKSIDTDEETNEDNQQINGFGKEQKRRETQDTEHHKMEKKITKSIDTDEETNEDDQQINGFGNGQKGRETQDTEHHKMEKEITKSIDTDEETNEEEIEKHLPTEHKKAEDKFEDLTYSVTDDDNIDRERSSGRTESLPRFQKIENEDDDVKVPENEGSDVRPKILGKSEKKLKGSVEKIPTKYKLMKKFNHENEIQKKKISAAKDDVRKTAEGRSNTKKKGRNKEEKILPDNTDKKEKTDRTQPKSRSYFSTRTKQYPEMNKKIKSPKPEKVEKTKKIKKDIDRTDKIKDTDRSDKSRDKYSRQPHEFDTAGREMSEITSADELTQKLTNKFEKEQSDYEGELEEGDSNRKKSGIPLITKKTETEEDVMKTKKKSKKKRKSTEQDAVKQVNLKGKKVRDKKPQPRDEPMETTKEIHERSIDIRDKLEITEEIGTEQVQEITDKDKSEENIILTKKDSKKEIEKKRRASYSGYHVKAKTELKETDEEKPESIQMNGKLDEMKIIDDLKYSAGERQSISDPPERSDEKDIGEKKNVLKIELNSEYLEILEDVALAKALEMEDILKISISPKTKTGMSIKDLRKDRNICKGACGKYAQKAYDSKIIDSELEWSPSSLININIIVDDSKKPKCICQKKISSQSIQNSNSLSNVLTRKSTNISSNVKGKFVSACKKTCNKVKCNCNRPLNFYGTSYSSGNNSTFPQNFPSIKELPSGNEVIFRKMLHKNSSKNISSHTRESSSVCRNRSCFEPSNVKPYNHLCGNILNKISEKETVEAHRSFSLKGKCFCGREVKFQGLEYDNSQNYNEGREYERFDFDKYTALSDNLDEEKLLFKCGRNPCFQQRSSNSNRTAENSSLKSCSLMKSTKGNQTLQCCINKNSRIIKPQYNENKINFPHSKCENSSVGRFTGKSSGKVSQVRDDIIDIEEVITKTESTFLEDKLCRKSGCPDLTKNCKCASFAPAIIPIFYSNTDEKMNISQELIAQNEGAYSLNEIVPTNSAAGETVVEINSAENVKTESQTVYRISSDNIDTPRINEEEIKTFKKEPRSENHNATVYNFIEILTQSEQKFVPYESNPYVQNHTEKSDYSIWSSDLSEYTYTRKMFDNIGGNTASSSNIEEFSLSYKEVDNNRKTSVSNKKSNKCLNKQSRKKKKEFLNNYEKQRSIIMRKRHKTTSKQQTVGIYRSKKNTDKIDGIQSEYIDTTKQSSLSFFSNQKVSAINKCNSVLYRSKHTAHNDNISLDKHLTMQKNSYSPYRTDPTLYHVAVETVENENQINTPNQRIKFRIAFFFKKSKGKIINWFKFLQTNKNNAEMNETKNDEEADRALMARNNIMKQKHILKSKLRQVESQSSKLYLYKKLYEERSRLEITDSFDRNQPKPVLQEIKSCDIVVPALEDDREEEESGEDQKEGDEDQMSLATSEQSSILFIRKEVYDRLQRYGKLRYTLYIGLRNELDHISIESLESVEDKIECDDQPFFATFDLGTRDVLVHVTKDTPEDEIREAVFKDEDYVACQSSRVKLSLMRGAKYLQQLDPTKANIIEIDCSNKLHEIKICYKKVENSKECICENPQMCKNIQLDSSDLSSVVIEKIDKFLDARELCENCERCKEKSKVCVDYQECSDEKCYVKKELVSGPHSSNLSEHSDKIEQDTSRQYSECTDGICSKKMDDDSSNGDDVNIETVHFVQVSHRYGFQEDIYPKKSRKNQKIEYHKKCKQEICVSKRREKEDLLNFGHLPQLSGSIQNNDRKTNVTSKNGSEMPFRKNEKQTYPITKRRRFQKRSSYRCNEDHKPTLILTITHFESILEILK